MINIETERGPVYLEPDEIAFIGANYDVTIGYPEDEAPYEKFHEFIVVVGYQTMRLRFETEVQALDARNKLLEHKE